MISAMKTFGLRLGTAYQIYDDCLDIAGDESSAGKTLGTDLRKGKLTLPMLHLLQNSSVAERHNLSEMILHGGRRRRGLAHAPRAGERRAALGDFHRAEDAPRSAGANRNRGGKQIPRRAARRVRIAGGDDLAVRDVFKPKSAG